MALWSPDQKPLCLGKCQSEETVVQKGTLSWTLSYTVAKDGSTTKLQSHYLYSGWASGKTANSNREVELPFVHTELGVHMLSQTLVTSMEFALPCMGNCGSTDIRGGLNYWGYGAGLPLTQKAGFLTQIWGFRFALTQKAGFLTHFFGFASGIAKS